jgi:hypothetical protein
MLDDLRNQASFKEEEPPEVKESKPPKPAKPPKPPKPPKKPRPRIQLPSMDKMTGMTPRQRFVLAVMLLIMVCLLGMMLLLVTGKVIPPFLG